VVVIASMEEQRIWDMEAVVLHDLKYKPHASKFLNF